ATYWPRAARDSARPAVATLAGGGARSVATAGRGRKTARTTSFRARVTTVAINPNEFRFIMKASPVTSLCPAVPGTDGCIVWIATGTLIAPRAHRCARGEPRR